MERTLIKNLKENTECKISGNIYKVRDTKYMVFIMIRDRSGYIQVSIDKKNENLTARALEITVGSVVSFYGNMVLSEYVKDGGKEFLPTDLDILSKAEAYPLDENALVDTRMDYRWLDLRDDKKHFAFILQSEFVKYLREYLYENEFTVIHTPKLLGAASESGSDVFEIKYFDRKAYLAQSPQFYKQMAMAAEFDRVFEVGPVFRAENSNTNRHCTEFTSFDVEMSYIDSYKDVMDLEYNMLTYAFTKLKENYGDKIKDKFGIDIKIPNKEYPVIKLNDLYKILHERYNYEIPDHDVGDLNAETEKLVCKYAMEEFNSEFIFITDYNKAKRAFYHMRDENDTPLGYDLLFKGAEITTGAQREHRYDKLVSQAKEKGLGKDVEFYEQFFKYGCAPHGGFAIGLERFMMLLLEFDQIRETQFIFRGPNRLNP